MVRKERRNPKAKRSSVKGATKRRDKQWSDGGMKAGIDGEVLV